MKSLLLCCAALLLCSFAGADELPLPRPAELEPDVQFWTRVYSEISTNEGFIHDQHNLSVVYETLHFDADTAPRERTRRVDAEREHIAGVLRRLARGGDTSADAEQLHVRELWGAAGTPRRFEQAAEDVRFQLGQSDRFRAGLVRSGAWQAHIAQVLDSLGLPPEIAALPHVESAFDAAAYSKVGAAGLWQFMRSTGRRFLRIDAAVDERLDPFRETEAAAQLLDYNYRLLGTWPLAITAYNHGADGMRRAREQVGTDDIVRIVREYHSPSFGFASRNYYVSFLAALAISRNPDRYFGDVKRAHADEFHELKLPSAATAAVLARTLDIDRDTLRELNPALRPLVWNGRRPVPAGYVLRLPSTGPAAPELLARLTAPRSASGDGASAAAPAPLRTPHAVPVVATLLAEPDTNTSECPQYYVVQRDDTVEAIAAATGLSRHYLMTINLLRDPDDIYMGERLRLLAAAAPESLNADADADDRAALAAMQESRDEQLAAADAKRQAATSEPVSKAEAQAEGPQLVSGLTGPESADPLDYSVAADGTIRVAAAETLGHYAEWLSLPSAHLRAENHLHARTPVMVGHRIKLDFAAVTREQFEQRRRDYHQQLQAAYFSVHRIAGSGSYSVRRGDSLWSITQHSGNLPVWLLQQYNPDLDLGDLRPGTQISLPKVERVAAL